MKISNIFCFNIRPKMVEYKHKKNTQKVDLKTTKYFFGGSKLGVISPKYPRKRVEKTWMCLTGVTVEVWWCPYFVIAAPTALLADSSSSASSYSSLLFFFLIWLHVSVLDFKLATQMNNNDSDWSFVLHDREQNCIFVENLPACRSRLQTSF